MRIRTIEDLLNYELQTEMTGIRFFNAVNKQIIFTLRDGNIALSKYADDKFKRNLLSRTMQRFHCSEEEAYALYNIVKNNFINYLNTGYCTEYEVVEKKKEEFTAHVDDIEVLDIYQALEEEPAYAY